MGLDMYLTADEYMWTRDRQSFNATFDFPVEQITYEVCYWRKANAIHKWFVDNVQEGEDDCGNYEVSKDQLKELLDIINQVLADWEYTNLLADGGIVGFHDTSCHPGPYNFIKALDNSSDYISSTQTFIRSILK